MALNEFQFSSTSYDRDQHRSTIRNHVKVTFSRNHLTQLRASCYSVLENIGKKYATSLQSVSNDANNITDDDSCASSNCVSSSSQSASYNDDSDSNWTGVADDTEFDDNIENLDSNGSECAVDKTPSNFNNEGGRNEMTVDIVADDNTSGSDESPFDTMPAQRQLDRHGRRSGRKPLDRRGNDALFCPGDVVEYKSLVSGGAVKRAAIAKIKDSKKHRYIVLDNDHVLRPKKHVVRKVKMYCGATGNLIANPLAQWHDVNDCTLQAGALEPENQVPQDDDSSAGDSYESDASSIDLGYVTHVGQKRQRAVTNEGLTNNKKKARMLEVRRWNKFMKAKMPYPRFAWTEWGGNEYFRAIETVNDRYRKMLTIGKAGKVFRNAQGGLCAMLSAKTKEQFQQAARNVNLSYTRYTAGTKSRLAVFRVKTELLPDPRKYQFEHIQGRASRPTNRQICVKEQILKFEHYLANLNVLKCSVCMECSIEEKPIVDESKYTCSACTRRRDPNFFIDNNLHPVWYLVDDDGNYVKDSQGHKIPQFDVPEELKRLSMGEKLLIRRCANMVPSVHIRSGIFGLKGHCVTFPQDITNMCNELPQRSESVVTFIRQIGNKDTTGGYPVMLKVKKANVIAALHWLKKHNPFYKHITIAPSNMDWMKGREEANLASVAETIEMKETARSHLAENEQEYVSRCHAQNPDPDESMATMPVAGMHANEKPTVPKGVQTAPIRELIDVARKTKQMTKAMDFPPIDHDSAIS